jgi:hypothetical protein
VAARSKWSSSQATLEVRRHFLPLFESDKRWFCVVAHRRAGKTVAAIQRLVRDALKPKQPKSNFAFVAPFFNQAKSIAFDYLKHMALALDGKVNESELRADFPNGSRIRLFGADNPDRLRGLRLDGVVMDEVAQMPRNLWGEVIRPALADRKGWAGFIGTPAGKNSFYDTHIAAQSDPEWVSLLLRADETGIIDDDEMRALRKTMTEEEWEQEFLCSFTAAIRGARQGDAQGVPWCGAARPGAQGDDVVGSRDGRQHGHLVPAEGGRPGAGHQLPGVPGGEPGGYGQRAGQAGVQIRCARPSARCGSS